MDKRVAQVYASTNGHWQYVCYVVCFCEGLAYSRSNQVALHQRFRLNRLEDHKNEISVWRGYTRALMDIGRMYVMLCYDVDCAHRPDCSRLSHNHIFVEQVALRAACALFMAAGARYLWITCGASSASTYGHWQYVCYVWRRYVSRSCVLDFCWCCFSTAAMQAS